MSVRKLIGGCLGLIAMLSGPAFAQNLQPAEAADATASSGSAAADSSYVLGPEDVVDVSAQGHSDFQTRARIGPDGSIQLPYIGTITAANKTIVEVGAEISRKLEAGGFFAHPIVKVDVVGITSRNVTVLGEVTQPGVVPLGRAFRLSEIIAHVGGLRAEAADYVILRAQRGPEKQYPVRELATGGPEQDPYVTPGDKIFVPKSEVFFVSGQVKSPGSYPLGLGMTLRMAIARGGGLTDSGSEGHVKVTRAGKSERVGLDSNIRAGDVIVVGERLF